MLSEVAKTKSLKKKAKKSSSQPILVRELKTIMRKTAEILKDERFYTQKGLSFNLQGKPSGVFNFETVVRSGDGWLLALAFDIYRQEKKAYIAQERIGKRILAQEGVSLVSITDDLGREAFIAALERAAR